MYLNCRNGVRHEGLQMGPDEGLQMGPDEGLQMGHEVAPPPHFFFSPDLDGSQE